MTRLRDALSVMLCVTLLSCSAPTTPRPDTAAFGLDQMFERLRTTANTHEADMLEVAILRAFAHSGRADVDALVEEGLEALHLGDGDQAMKAFDEVVHRAPDFAEGWNLRANAQIGREDYGAALHDFHRAISLEPRHFAAMTGMGRILLFLGHKQAALHAFTAALAINPHLDDIHRQVDSLTEELAGIPI